MNADAREELDYRGLRCPLPVLRARRALKGLAGGTEVVIRCDDPSAPGDFRAFCEATGHVLLGTSDVADGSEIRLRVKDA